MAKKVLKIVGGVLGALVLIVVIYVVYVMASYYRLDDSLSLETASPEEGQVESAIELDTGSQGPSSRIHDRGVRTLGSAPMVPISISSWMAVVVRWHRVLNT